MKRRITFVGAGNRRQLRNAGISLIALGVVLLPMGLRGDGSSFFNTLTFPDPTGLVQVFNQNGAFDFTGPFFQSLGTNGRSCGTCHQPSDAMSVSAAHVQLRFDLTAGLDPIFRTVDGSNCDHNIDTSTVA